MPRALRSWRWLVVLAGVGALVSLPAVIGALPVHVASVDPATLVASARASADEPYAGYVQTRGGLALPDLPGLVDQVQLLGETSHLRVWFGRPDTWRVDVLNPAGEQDMFAGPDGLWQWTSNRRQAQRVQATLPLRLPWPFDLVPPELGRRLLAGAHPNEVEAIAPARVGGRSVPGVRVTPSDPVSTVDHADVWIEPASGLPVRVTVTPRDSTHPSVESQFLDLSIGPPDSRTMAFTPPARSRVRRSTAVDPLAQAGRASSIVLPDELAGLARGAQAGPGVAAFGTGFHIVTVVVIPAVFLRQLVPDAIATSVRPWGGEAQVIETSLVNTMAFSSKGTGYVVSGAVTVAELDRIGAALEGLAA